MKLLCTFPGKFGDLLWALPTIRAISRRIGAPVDLVVAAPFASICPLIAAQPYIQTCVPLTWWKTEDTAPISPRVPPYPVFTGTEPWDQVIHLGYRDWPLPDVARHTLDTYNQARAAIGTHPPYILEAELDLETPWITAPPAGDRDRYRWACVYGFTDEHFELKYGLTQLLERPPLFWRRRDRTLPPTTLGANARWMQEAGTVDTTWIESAQLIARADVVLADCSALHVLAAAMGRPVILMEPNPHRHNDVFYPLGKTGRVRLVTGNDGQPTWDSRHVRDALEEVLGA